MDCTFSSAVVTPKDGPVVSKLTVTTTAPRRSTAHALLWIGIPGISLLFAKNKGIRPKWSAYLLLLVMIAIAACGGGTTSNGSRNSGNGKDLPDTGTPTGTLNITVQATSGVLKKTLGLEINVQ